jgi:hypothetical protein
MHWTSGWPDYPAFFISGFQPDTGFDLTDIQPDTKNSRISGSLKTITLIHKFFKK